MPIQKLRPTFTFIEDRLKQLEQVVPEAFADGKIDWETLQEALGEELEDGREEHFGLTWPGKREARRLASIPSKGTLVPCPGEGVNEDNTNNIFIEGENLEVLKILQKSYAGKIKMIYIDPPYNTGSDLIYNDNFTDPLDAYLKYINAVGEGGEVLTSNTRADGRFHSNWMNMIYPRLILAKQLLKENGVIFVSIDDNEVHHLRELMSELFGDENFLGCIVRATGTTTGQDSAKFGGSFDYILSYSKTNNFELGGLPLSEEDKARFSEEDAVGKYSLLQMRKTGNADRREDRPSMFYPIIDPAGKKVYPIGPGGYESRWRFGQETFKKYLLEDLIVWKKRNHNGEDGYVPYVKFYLEGREKRPSPLWNDIDGNKKATLEVKTLLGEKIFNNPKPVMMLSRLLDISIDDDQNDIVLDFFAGSSTTAHAVMKKNIEDQINIKFIMVQVPELTGRIDYSTIADLGKERIRRAIAQLKKENPLYALDLGFNVFKYGHSNFKSWLPDQISGSFQALDLFEDHITPLQSACQTVELVTELLLIEGFPLTTKLTPLDSITTNTVYEASAPDFCDHKLFICLDEKLAILTADQLVLDRNDIFICLDSALTDELKVRLADRFNVHMI